MAIVFLSGSENPDSSSVVNKSRIDISFSSTDVDLCGYSGSIQPNYTFTGQLVIAGQKDVTGYVYYTPIYTEKLSYRVWKNTVNKNFEELT